MAVPVFVYMLVAHACVKTCNQNVANASYLHITVNKNIALGLIWVTWVHLGQVLRMQAGFSFWPMQDSNIILMSVPPTSH